MHDTQAHKCCKNDFLESLQNQIYWGEGGGGGGRGTKHNNQQTQVQTKSIHVHMFTHSNNARYMSNRMTNE